jgi:hypothetical protein
MIDPLLEEQTTSASGSTLRQFAGLWVLFFGWLACWQSVWRGHVAWAIVFAALALAVGLRGLIWPQTIRPVFALLTAVTLPIGWVMSRVILAVLFYGVFTPVAIFFRLIGRDILGRRPAPNCTTYWTPKPAPSDVQSYFRQS